MTNEHQHNSRTRTRTTDTLHEHEHDSLTRSAVFGPNHHEHESQCQISKLEIPGKLEKRAL